MIIAIDGVAGAGKSTVAKEISKRTGFYSLNSGAIFRTVALAFTLQENKEISEKNLKKILKKIKIEIKFANNSQQTLLNGKVVDDKIHTADISEITSKISQLKCVRSLVLKIQRKASKRNDLVVEGRDIGTTVFPKAKLKIFLTADPKERAKRRLKELEEKGEKHTLSEITQQIIKRDKLDETRKISPLRCAKDAIKIDTTKMTILEVTDEILKNLNKKEK